jgi:hypothetical protein
VTIISLMLMNRIWELPSKSRCLDPRFAGPRATLWGAMALRFLAS